jgi:hypothetical protein
VKDEKILFSETQRLTQWWLWLLLFAILGAMIFKTDAVIDIESYGFGNFKSLIPALLWSLIMVFIYSFKLQTIITDKAIYFKYSPFHRKFKKFTIENIESLKIVKYKPIADYLGWGIRVSFSTGIIAYTTSGNRGLEICISNQSIFLLGTQDPEKLLTVFKDSTNYKSLLKK